MNVMDNGLNLLTPSKCTAHLVLPVLHYKKSLFVDARIGNGASYPKENDSLTEIDQRRSSNAILIAAQSTLSKYCNDSKTLHTSQRNAAKPTPVTGWLYFKTLPLFAPIPFLPSLPTIISSNPSRSILQYLLLSIPRTHQQNLQPSTPLTSNHSRNGTATSTTLLSRSSNTSSHPITIKPIYTPYKSSPLHILKCTLYPYPKAICELFLLSHLWSDKLPVIPTQNPPHDHHSSKSPPLPITQNDTLQQQTPHK